MNDRHICATENVYTKFLQGEIFVCREKERWLIKIKLKADKKMVIDGEAEYEGQDIFEYNFGIDYCPFCGVELHK